MSTALGLDDYLAGVRAALSDLPEDELSELMDDVVQHVTEVFGEPGSPVERLGTPQEYAAELRAAGGYPPPEAEPVATRRGRGRFVFWTTGLTAALTALVAMAAVREREYAPLVALILAMVLFVPAVWLVFSRKVARADIVTLPEYRRLAGSLDGVRPGASSYLRSLRPAWPLVWIVVLALSLVAALGAAPPLAVAILSVGGLLLWLAKRVGRDRRLLVLAVPAYLFVGGCAVALASTAVAGHSSGPEYYAVGNGSPYGLVYNGKSLSTVYAVDRNGDPIPEFYLYGDEGAPITLSPESCMGPSDHPRNRFPMPRAVDRHGMCVIETGPPFIPLPPVGAERSAEPSASLVPSPTASESPSASVSPTASESPSVSVSPSAAPPTVSVTPTK